MTMSEEERERLMSEIHERRMEPGIALEWHQVEMRRRYELDWERRNQIARQEQEAQRRRRLEDETQPHPLVLPLVSPYEELMRERMREEMERQKSKGLAKERKYREYHEVLDQLTPDQVKELSEHLARFGRKFPQTGRSLSKALMAFRAYRKTEAEWADDRRAYEQYMPYETLWSVEMRDYMRVAYMPLRIRDCPFSQMQECSIWTGATTMPSFMWQKVAMRKKLQAAEMPECGKDETK